MFSGPLQNRSYVRFLTLQLQYLHTNLLNSLTEPHSVSQDSSDTFTLCNLPHICVLLAAILGNIMSNYWNIQFIIINSPLTSFSTRLFLIQHLYSPVLSIIFFLAPASASWLVPICFLGDIIHFFFGRSLPMLGIIALTIPTGLNIESNFSTGNGSYLARKRPWSWLPKRKTLSVRCGSYLYKNLILKRIGKSQRFSS